MAALGLLVLSPVAFSARRVGTCRALLVDAWNVHHGGKGSLKGVPSQDMDQVRKRLGDLYDTHGIRFDKENVDRLSDDPRYHRSTTVLRPCKEHTINSLLSMIGDCEDGDTFVFWYSGHGGQENDADGNPRSCLFLPNDEADHAEYYEQLWDSEINDILEGAKPGVKILVILDACHSGYMARQPYRYNSVYTPSPKEKDNYHFFRQRYDGWKRQASWQWSGYIAHCSQRRGCPNKQACIHGWVVDVAAREKVKESSISGKPLIICLSAAEHVQTAKQGHRLEAGQLVGTDSSLFSASENLDYGFFTIRMLSFMFGDKDYDGTDHWRNGTHSLPIGQQFYMALDSDNLLIQKQTPVMTSNCKFEVESFSICDLFTKTFTQGRDNYYFAAARAPPGWSLNHLPLSDWNYSKTLLARPQSQWSGHNQWPQTQAQHGQYTHAPQHHQQGPWAPNPYNRCTRRMRRLQGLR